jgi:uncharacterized spore protein YtfJ
MKDVKQMVATVGERLRELATGNATVATPVVVGSRQVIPLCELSIGFGAGGGTGEGTGHPPHPHRGPAHGTGTGTGGMAAGGAKACPVALIVVDGGEVRIEGLGQ